MRRRRRSFEAKLDRATKQLKDFEAEVRAWLARDPYRVFIEFDPERQKHVVYVEVEERPDSLAHLVGECLQNLRQSLDHLAYELLLACSGDPPPGNTGETSEFPIFIDRPMTEYERTRKIGGIDPAAQAIIEELQPYVRQQPRDPLALLYQLARVDRHRTLLVTNSAVSPWGIGGSFTMSDIYVESAGRPFESKTELFTFRSAGPPPGGDEMQVNLDMTLQVTLAQGPPAEGAPVGETLTLIRDYIRSDVFARLAPFL